MSKATIIIVLSSIVLLALPLPTAAFSLVPCGQNVVPGKQPGPENEPCQFRHLIILIIRLINYLISTAALVAMYYVLLSGFNLVTALGDPEKIKKNKLGITHAVVGFAIIILAFVFVNLLVNGIFGKPDAPRNWWNPNCLYDITNTTGCPVGAGSTGATTATGTNTGAGGGSGGSAGTGGTGGTTGTTGGGSALAPANLKLSVSSAFAGVKDQIVEGGVVTYKPNDITLTITGQNLAGTTLTSDAQSITGGPGIIVKSVTPSNDKLDANVSILPDAKAGSVKFTVKNGGGKSADVNFEIKITGTQWLQRQFLEKRIKFFGDWPEAVPNEKVQDIANEINLGLQAINNDSYDKLDIWINIFEIGFWDSPGVSTAICPGLYQNMTGAGGCADSYTNVINLESVGAAHGIIHESAHKLHAYYDGTYRGISGSPWFPNSFVTSWASAVGDLGSCAYLPLRDAVTWKDGENYVPHCGFIEAYGVNDASGSVVMGVIASKNYEDVATMTTAAVLHKVRFNSQEVKTDPRYKQKLDLLKQYGFITSSPLGLTGSQVFASITSPKEGAHE